MLFCKRLYKLILHELGEPLATWNGRVVYFIHRHHHDYRLAFNCAICLDNNVLLPHKS